MKKRLAMLDLLLTAEKNNMINSEGIKEEVETFTFEVRCASRNCISVYLKADFVHS